MARGQDIISEARTATAQAWAAVNKLRALAKEIDARGGAGTLPAGEGANDGISAADVTAVTHTSLPALETFLAAGHATNASKLL